MGHQGGIPDPSGARTPDEFVSLMRRLKQWSGLTYRQLAARAEQHGADLPRSTTAAVLSRRRLPRPQFVESFTHACEQAPAPWLAARRRLAMDETAPEPVQVRPQPDPRDSAPTHAPAQLPPAVPDFTGRDVYAAELIGRFAHSGSSGGDGTVRVAVLSGMGGVGKTSLALHVAHAIAGDHPGGQLFVDLRGADPVPASPERVLVRFLLALGVDGASVPDAAEERAALYRSVIAGRRTLIVLDNAASEEQVRPLLPGTPENTVLITSRVRLNGLEYARTIDLDVLEPASCGELLSRIVGGARVAAEPGAAARIADLCGHIPLAVRIAGARLAGRRQWSLARMADMLGDERRRLDELAVGDLAVRTSFALSYDGLPPATRRAFRLLGLPDASQFAAWTAAAVTGDPADRAEAHVEELVDAQLLIPVNCAPEGELRYRMHDLVKLFARDRAGEEEAADSRDAALDRALGCWLSTAEHLSALVPGPCYQPMHGDALRWMPEGRPAAFDSDPLAWFDAEWPAVVAMAGQACARDRTEAAWDLAGCLERYFDVRGLFDEWRRLHRQVIAACRGAGNLRGEAVLRRGLADFTHWTSTEHSGTAMGGQLDEARSVLTMFRELGDQHGVSDALEMRTWGLIAQGSHVQARESGEAALETAETLGYLGGQARARHVLAIAAHGTGDTAGTVRHLTGARDLARSLGNARFEATAIQFLGAAFCEAGDVTTGHDHLQRSLEMARELDDQYLETFSLVCLARLYVRTGHPDAQPTVRAATMLSSRFGMNHHLADSLGLSGEIALEAGDTATAVTDLEESVRLWRSRGWLEFLARALVVLGRAYRAAGRHEVARGVLVEARGLYEQVAKADAVREVEDLLSLDRPATPR